MFMFICTIGARAPRTHALFHHTLRARVRRANRCIFTTCCRVRVRVCVHSYRHVYILYHVVVGCVRTLHIQHTTHHHRIRVYERAHASHGRASNLMRFHILRFVCMVVFFSSLLLYVCDAAADDDAPLDARRACAR